MASRKVLILFCIINVLQPIFGEINWNGVQSSRKSTTIGNRTISYKLQANTNYLLVAERRQISRIDLSTNEKLILPIGDLLDVTAVQYDANGNCVMWSDRAYNIIGRQCLNDDNRSMEVLAAIGINEVTHLAYDWMSELLFFIDSGRQTVEMISTSGRGDATLGRMHRTIIQAREDMELFSLVVHPGHGYIFWCEYHRNGQHIARANLDGSQQRVLVRLTDFDIRHPLAIDYEDERIYWLNVLYNYIARCSIHGNSCVKVVTEQRKYNVYRALVVQANQIYWYEYRQKSIRRAIKEKRAVGVTVPVEVEDFRAMQFLSTRMQAGSNACSCGAHNCSHVCVGAPNRKHSCLCPDGFQMDEIGHCYCPLGEDEECCMTFAQECPYGYFQCRKHGKCIDV